MRMDGKLRNWQATMRPFPFSSLVCCCRRWSTATSPSESTTDSVHSTTVGSVSANATGAATPTLSSTNRSTFSTSPAQTTQQQQQSCLVEIRQPTFPDTQEGHAQYQRAINIFNATHPQTYLTPPLDEPYPLKPGMLSAASVNDPFITEADKLRTFEHEPGSRIYISDYLLDRVEIDVLSLLRRHEQCVNLIRGRGIKKVPYVELNCEDELSIVDNDETVRTQMRRCDKLKERLIEETGTIARCPCGLDPLYDEYCSAQSSTQSAQNRIRERIREQRGAALARAFQDDVFRHTSSNTNPENSSAPTELAGMAAPSPWQQPQVPSADEPTQERLCELEHIYTEFTTLLSQNFDPYLKVNDLFQSDADRISLSKFDEYLSTGYGTTTHKWSGRPCESCGADLDDLPHPKKHILGCFASTFSWGLAEEQLALLKRQGVCPYEGCADTFAKTNKFTTIQVHLNQHVGRTANGCVCDNHETWNVSVTKVQRHFESHLPAGSLDGEVSLPPKTCAFCFVDVSLDAYHRARTWIHALHLGKHVNEMHLLHLQHVPPCPTCRIEYGGISGLIRHVDAFHNVKLTKRGRIKHALWDGRLESVEVNEPFGAGLKRQLIGFWGEESAKKQSDDTAEAGASAGNGRIQSPTHTAGQNDRRAIMVESHSESEDSLDLRISTRHTSKRRATRIINHSDSPGIDSDNHTRSRRAGKQRATITIVIGDSDSASEGSERHHRRKRPAL